MVENLHPVDVVGQTDAETADDVRGEVVSVGSGDAGHAGQHIGVDEHGQTSDHVAQQSEQKTAQHGAQEEHCLCEVAPPVVVTHPVLLLRAKSPVDSISFPFGCCQNRLMHIGAVV